MSELLNAIHAIVGDQGLITDERVAQRPNESWSKGSCPAKAVIRPASTEEVSKVLALCHEANQTIIPQAGMTGLADATKATEGDFVLSLERMRSIEQLDTQGATVLVQAGVVVEDLQNAAAEHDLLFAVDWGARGSAQVAGMLAANAGGNKVIRYGMARDQVLGLEVVLADGTVLTNLKETLKDNTGYDLKQLFVGSEGTLGIITRAVLRLWPSAPARQTALVGVESFDNALLLLNTLKQKLEGKLSAFEAMWNSFYSFMVNETGNHQKFIDDSLPYYILVESECVDDTRGKEQFIEVLGELLEQEVIVDAVIAESQQQSAALWAVRDDIEAMVQAFSPLIPYDISLPLRHMEAYTNEVKEALSEQFPESTCLTFGHLGDGNIHFCVGPVSDKKAIDTVVYKILEKYKGSVSAEHGIGLSKKPYIHLSRSDAELAVMRSIKAALDPKGILNPGKIIG
jgi:FAD/FMN-containing dehydrogenase